MKGSRATRLTSSDGQFFFGYYDKCPWNRGEELVLAGRTEVVGRQPRQGEELTVGILNRSNGYEFVPVGSTAAWNFQQGAMLQWLVSREGKELIIFNAEAKDGSFRARVVDTLGKPVFDLAFPIYALSTSGRWAASVDFRRLAWLRPGYGYRGQQGQRPAPDDDGLMLGDLVSGTTTVIVSYKQLASEVFPRGRDAAHWIDHIEFSPDSRRIVFLHRWLAAGKLPITRVMCLDLDRHRLTCALDSGTAGHGTWLDSNRYAIWGRRAAKIARTLENCGNRRGPSRFAVHLARKLIPLSLKSRIHHTALLILNFADGSCSEALEPLPHKFRFGHPSKHPHTPDLIVLDTLPNSRGARWLLLCSLHDNSWQGVLVLGEDPFAETPFRTDLHPRWDRVGKRVCVDAFENGRRGMYEVDLSHELNIAQLAQRD